MQRSAVSHQSPLRFLRMLCLLWAGTLYADPQTLAPGYGVLQFTPPPAGSYQLPVIDQAADGELLDIHNTDTHLHHLMGDKFVLLSFIYSACSDVNGCPLATGVFHKINRQLRKTPQIAQQLRLLTLSFNPLHDTPEVMQRYAAGFRNDEIDWQFFTTRSEQHLQPILQHYRQGIQKLYDADGQFNGTYAHILRVYLIDRQKQIRNIYSVSFLHADTLINDVKTLLMEEQANIIQTAANSPAYFQAGDNKQQYASTDYQTQSIALTHRQGQALPLLDLINPPPLGLPTLPVPEDNPVTAEKISLGRKLFFDRRLSLNNTFSCAMCHIPEQGFSSNEMKTAVGIEGRSVRRNTPTLYNIGYASRLFHDGREDSLEQQVWAPLLAENEMGNPSIGYVINKIKSLTDYQGRFEQAFGKPVNMLNLGQALASYQRSLNSADSAFDRWFYNGEKQALNDSARRGFKLFTGKARCNACHRVDKTSALFSDNQLHNTGIGYRESMHSTQPTQKVQLAPGVFTEVDNAIIDGVAEKKRNDLGLYEITQNPADRWKYKTPSLRNIALTAPYMHNGSMSTLQDVMQFYNQGGIDNPGLSPFIKPLHLSNAEIDDLIAFLNSLQGANVHKLVADAFAAPIGN